MRINLFGGPNTGKTRTRSRLFSDLTINYNIEEVREFIKDWAYLKRLPKSFDPVYIFGQQMHLEDMPLQCGVEHLVTDSPLLMQIAYMQRYAVPYWLSFLEIAREFEEKYPSLNIFLDRGDITYRQNGRYENLNQAKEMDRRILDFLKLTGTEFVVVPTTDYDQILKTVVERLGEPPLAAV